VVSHRCTPLDILPTAKDEGFRRGDLGDRGCVALRTGLVVFGTVVRTVVYVSPHPVSVYTDGSAIGNPGPAGWAWWCSDVSWASGGWVSATNNAAELTAIFDVLVQLSGSPAVPVRVFSDSTYAINSLTVFVSKWRENGWVTASGKPVANVNIIRPTVELMDARRFPPVLSWVKGHAGVVGNEKADGFATQASARFAAGVGGRAGPGFTFDAPPSVVTSSAARLFPRRR
jgi:ribonuclease HI